MFKQSQKTTSYYVNQDEKYFLSENQLLKFSIWLELLRIDP